MLIHLFVYLLFRLFVCSLKLILTSNTRVESCTLPRAFASAALIFQIYTRCLSWINILKENILYLKMIFVYFLIKVHVFCLNSENGYINQYYEYIRIDMIVNQDKLFSINFTMLRNIWTQTRQNLAD